MSSYIDPIQENIDGVRQLVSSELNKMDTSSNIEGAIGDFEDVLSLKLSDEELLDLSERWESDYVSYEAGIKRRQELNSKYLDGRIKDGNVDNASPITPSNLIFEATATFVPAALAKNPSPVVYPASNSQKAIEIAKDVKTMLQYHADVQVLKRKLGQMVWHWSVYFIGALKHGFDTKVQDIQTDITNPQNLILDPKATIDVYGNYTGDYLGERKECTGKELIDMFDDESNDQSSLSAEKIAYINTVCQGKLGTKVKYTEWWTNEYCFYTFKGIVLDKHKNQFWKYGKNARNHFGRPKMPYTFLSVFSLGKQPHDFTNLIEQNIPNQDLVVKRIDQIDRNLDVTNNSLAVSAENFTNETAKQASDAIQSGRPIIVPRGKSIDQAIQRLPASGFPSDAFEQLSDMTNRLRGVYGIQGITPSGLDQDRTVRGKIITSQQDASRIGGGIGDALEQVADNVFNWWVQLYYVFYNEKHYAAILGSNKAVEYITFSSNDISEKIVVSVAPNSMKPRDEITEINLATDRWATGAIDPISYMIAINDPDPMESAEKLVLWKANPQMYFQKYFNQSTAVQSMQDPENNQMELQGIDTNLSALPPNPSLSAVPINSQSMPQ